MILRTRGYLPHLQTSDTTYFLTFRLEDSLPVQLFRRWKEELQFQRRVHLTNQNKLFELDQEYFTKIQKYLDNGAGNCWLKNPAIASIVAGALRYFDGQRYFLHAWTIMPNHVHVLFTLSEGISLSSTVHTWKSFTAHRANRLLKISGRFWQPEYFDRAIKSERQFEFTVRYILNNPVKAGLCKEMHHWPWSGFSGEIEGLVKRYWP